MKYLGYANGWSDIPELVKEQEERELPLVVEVVGRSLRKYTCKELGFYYYIDSSD